MITKTKQNWSVGQTVNVGFLKLIVESIELTPFDYKPDAYILRNTDNSKRYRFVPHNGLERIDNNP